MSQRSWYKPGTPSWVDLDSPDPTAAMQFYGQLFGWDAEVDRRPTAAGSSRFTLAGSSVAGLGPQVDPEVPPSWAVYVTVDDIDQTLHDAADTGGSVVVEPQYIFESGRMAIIQDREGCFISLWEPHEHIGAQVVNEPGSFTWNELATPDLASACDFYPIVFGWGLDPETSSDTSAIFTVEGNIVCGAHAATEGEHPAWSVWFAVDDCDASAATAVALGGSLILPPNDMAFGRGAVVADPHGAAFGIGAMSDAFDADR